MHYLNILTKTAADTSLLRKVLADLGRQSKQDIYLSLCSKSQIQALNKKYRRINKPTDVLSFSSGDIIITPAIAKVNAKKYHNSLNAELIYLLIHGFCHLHGHDHAGQKDTKRMRQAENKFLTYIRKKYNIIITGRI